MYQTYAAIGAILSFTALIFVYYFIRLLTVNKDILSINSLSDALATVFIGFFYVYSAIILSTPEVLKDEKFNFTNNIDDIVTNNQEMPELDFTNMNTGQLIPATEESMKELSNKTTVTVESIKNITETSPSAAQIDKRDEFLAKYQTFLKEVLKNKLTNHSLHWNNATFLSALSEMKPSKPKSKRELDVTNKIEENENCFERFYENALLIYSFIHCLISLFNTTLQCKKCPTDVSKPEIEENNQETSKETIYRKSTNNQAAFEDSNSEKNEEAAPVKPLFSDEEKDNTSLDKNKMEIFQAKCKRDPSQTNKNDKNDKDTVVFTEKCKIISQILITWFTPVLCLLLIYFTGNTKIIKTEMVSSSLTLPNFNTTRADPNILNIVRNGSNISELNEIVNKVYQIVHQVQRNYTNKPPKAFDVLQVFKDLQRSPKEIVEHCPLLNAPVKILYFLIFVAAYFSVILYSKITEEKIKSRNSETASKLNKSLITFSTLWLPGIIDILVQTFLAERKSNILTDIFLSLGNANQLITMVSNYNECKKNTHNKINVIKPVT